MKFYERSSFALVVYWLNGIVYEFFLIQPVNEVVGGNVFAVVCLSSISGPVSQTGVGVGVGGVGHPGGSRVSRVGNLGVGYTLDTLSPRITKAGGTHPTGMFSCDFSVFSSGAKCGHGLDLQ